MAAVEKSGEKSRRDRRKEARLVKNKKKFDSWVQHQQCRESKKSLPELNSEPVQKSPMDNILKGCTMQPQKVKKSIRNSTNLIPIKGVSSEDYSEQLSTIANTEIKLKESKRKKGLGKCSKSSFSQYLEMEMGGRSLSVDEDVKIERKLAKRLKVKNGRLSTASDDIDALLEGIPTVLDSLGESEEIHEATESGKIKVNNSDDEWNEVSNSTVASCEELNNVVEEVILPNDANKVKGRKTKFEEYLEADILGGRSLAEADFALERKLAKKLKVKEGDPPGDDEINLLFEGIPSVDDSSKDGQLLVFPRKDLDNGFSAEKLKTSKPRKGERTERANDSDIRTSAPVKASSADVVHEKFPNNAPAKYVAPHLRSGGGDGSEEYAQLRKRIRGLLNKLLETNVESITGEVSSLFDSAGHIVCSQIVCEEVVASCSGGPRGNEQYAAVFAASVAGMACLVGIDFGAKLLACLAKSFEEEYLKEDNLSLRNLTLLLSYVYVFGVCSSELMYDFLIILSKRLTEVDVSTVLTVLQCCGMKLRGDDPSGMKNFISSVQGRANDFKESNMSSKRMEFMLETICDIKNNKKRSKVDTLQHTRVKKWLQKLKVDDILIRGLTWSQLLDPNKKGQWWLSGDITSDTDNLEEVAGTIDKEIPETKKMLQLAAAQRMNTDARRAIFCIIMSGEDYIDAFEKLLRLELPGKQDREIMRVLVECCLQEKIFNKYYCLLASKLCSFDKNHKFTLQFCLWDHFKELDSMPLIRAMHLAKFVAEMVACFSLSLAVLKTVELNDGLHLTPKRIMHFRVLFEAIFEFSDKLLWNVFTRIAMIPEYESLRNGIVFFITKYVVSSQNSLTKKFKIARKALNNIEGVVM